VTSAERVPPRLELAEHVFLVTVQPRGRFEGGDLGVEFRDAVGLVVRGGLFRVGHGVLYCTRRAMRKCPECREEDTRIAHVLRYSVTSQLRKLEDAQHEAAHLLVGHLAGLRLREAVLANTRGVTRGEYVTYARGYVTFHAHMIRDREALALTYAAGVAWESRRSKRATIAASGDRAAAFELGVTRTSFRACVRLAGALLRTHASLHAAFTRALLERDLRQTDVDALVRGEGLPDL
jgi:hypothetical protein